ncbi:MAG: uracil-DNA glycosylase [Calditrichia bacterium]
MAERLPEKIKAFLQWYEDIYGKYYYVTKEHLEKNTEPEDAAGESGSKLSRFYDEIKNCTKCSLHQTRTNFVFGVGNPKADIMFVGEAPGKYEDLQGEPFVGRAGQLLNKLLAHIHLQRKDVYIANILKCRPPNNRDPLPEEVEKCIPYLHRQIELIQPKILVALGRIAAQNLLNTSEPLGKLKQKVWTFSNLPLFITYHPAAVLRNQGLLDTALQDFRMILKHYKQITGS